MGPRADPWRSSMATDPARGTALFPRSSERLLVWGPVEAPRLRWWVPTRHRSVRSERFAAGSCGTREPHIQRHSPGKQFAWKPVSER
jgi:hypothetical protein